MSEKYHEMITFLQRAHIDHPNNFSMDMLKSEPGDQQNQIKSNAQNHKAKQEKDVAMIAK